MIGIMQRQSRVFQQKGELLTIFMYNLGLNCSRWEEWSLYINWKKLEMIEVVCKVFISTGYLLDFQCRNNMLIFPGQE